MIRKYIPRNYKEQEYAKFKGLIYLSDFDTETKKSKNIADRITADWKFDEQCRKNAQSRDYEKKKGLKL